MAELENNAKKTLQDYYRTLPRLIQPKTNLLEQIVTECNVTKQAAQRWTLHGLMPSSKEHCDIIARITGRPVQELFPLYNEKFPQYENVE